MFRPSRLFLMLGGLMALAILCAAPAFAGDTTISAGPAFSFAEPYLRSLADVAVTGIIGWVAVLVQRWTGVQIEARHREALHSAAMTGVTRAIARLGVRLDNMTVDVRSETIAWAIEWIESSVPDAIAKLGVTPDKVEALATAKLGQLIAGGQAVSPPIFNVTQSTAAGA